MPAAKLRPVGPSTTTRPPVMYSQPWSPTPSTTADHAGVADARSARRPARGRTRGPRSRRRARRCRRSRCPRPRSVAASAADARRATPPESPLPDVVVGVALQRERHARGRARRRSSGRPSPGRRPSPCRRPGPSAPCRRAISPESSPPTARFLFSIGRSARTCVPSSSAVRQSWSRSTSIDVPEHGLGRADPRARRVAGRLRGTRSSGAQVDAPRLPVVHGLVGARAGRSGRSAPPRCATPSEAIRSRASSATMKR